MTPSCYFDQKIILKNLDVTLTLSWRWSLSYRNQSIDLHSKLMDWFLYGRVLRHERVNCQHPNIRFTCEIEENNSISFLEIKIRRVNNSFSTNIYRKVTFSGVFTNFESFIPVSYKSNLIFTLLFRAFKLCSNFELFHQEIPNLKDIFKRNGYPCNFIDVCIKRFLNNIFIDKKLYALVP